MAGGRRSPKTSTERELSERQRYWLKHLRAAEGANEPMKAYAKRLGLSAQSMYEAKRRLRAYGVVAPAATPALRSAGFARVTVSAPSPSPTSFRVRIASEALLEWSEAPRGEALRELIGVLCG